MQITSLRPDPFLPTLPAPMQSLNVGQELPPITRSYAVVLLSLISTLERMHAVGSDLHETQSAQLVELQGHLEELQKQNLEIRKQIEQKAHTSGVWTALGKALDYILAATRYVLGSLLAENAPGASQLLRITSLIAIANLALSACGAWQWFGDHIAQENEELANQIATLAPVLLSLVSIGLGFMASGEIAALAADQINIGQQILRVVETTLGFAAGVTSISKGVIDHEVYTSKAELTGFRKGMSLDEHALEKLMREMEQTMQTLE
ncbi:MAG: hypothetical protein ACHQT8_06375, partial [Chlamydiales bacterium]